MRKSHLDVIARQSRRISLVDIQQYKEQDINDYDVNFGEVREFERGNSEVWLLKRNNEIGECSSDSYDYDDEFASFDWSAEGDEPGAEATDCVKQEYSPITNMANYVKMKTRINLGCNCAHDDGIDVDRYISLIHAPGNPIERSSSTGDYNPDELEAYSLENMRNISHFFYQRKLWFPLRIGITGLFL